MPFFRSGNCGSEDSRDLPEDPQVGTDKVEMRTQVSWLPTSVPSTDWWIETLRISLMITFPSSAFTPCPTQLVPSLPPLNSPGSPSLPCRPPQHPRLLTATASQLTTSRPVPFQPPEVHQLPELLLKLESDHLTLLPPLLWPPSERQHTNVISLILDLR